MAGKRKITMELIDSSLKDDLIDIGGRLGIEDEIHYKDTKPEIYEKVVKAFKKQQRAEKKGKSKPKAKSKASPTTPEVPEYIETPTGLVPTTPPSAPADSDAEEAPEVVPGTIEKVDEPVGPPVRRLDPGTHYFVNDEERTKQYFVKAARGMFVKQGVIDFALKTAKRRGVGSFKAHARYRGRIAQFKFVIRVVK